jgi:hypothetical protein
VWQVPTVVAVMSTEHGDLTPHGYSKENEGGRNHTCMLRAGRRPGGAGVARRKGHAGAAVTRMSGERKEKWETQGSKRTAKDGETKMHTKMAKCRPQLRCNRRPLCVVELWNEAAAA